MNFSSYQLRMLLKRGQHWDENLLVFYIDKVILHDN